MKVYFPKLITGSFIKTHNDVWGDVVKDGKRGPRGQQRKGFINVVRKIVVSIIIIIRRRL